MILTRPKNNTNETEAVPRDPTNDTRTLPTRASRSFSRVNPSAVESHSISLRLSLYRQEHLWPVSRLTLWKSHGAMWMSNQCRLSHCRQDILHWMKRDYHTDGRLVSVNVNHLCPSIILRVNSITWFANPTPRKIYTKCLDHWEGSVN